MKRRVLRAHANKRQLRLIFTTNHLSNPNIFHVLCDASFLRTVIHSYWSSHNGGDEDDFQSGGVGGVMAFMQDTVVSAFNIIDNHHLPASKPLKETYRKCRLNERKKKACNNFSSVITVKFYYLPETEIALRRMMANSNSRDDTKATVNALFANVEGASPAPSQHRKSAKQHAHSFRPIHNSKTERDGDKVVRALFLGMTKLTHTNRIIEKEGENPRQVAASTKDDHNTSKTVCNEVKVIEAFARQYCSHERGCSYPGWHASVLFELSTPSPAKFFFIATQSHDMRRRLPAQAALLRWAHNPDCVWIELKSATYSYPDDSVHSVTHDGAGGQAGPSRFNGAELSRLSAADIAFMMHLGVLQGGTGCGRKAMPSNSVSHCDPINESSKVSKSEVAGEVNSHMGEASLPCDVEHSPAVGNRKRKRQRNPNPLSMKKKQKRESFRIR
ncbi:unnamed protein product [Phytomonas sp. EM1]|nr:unnamed protein product [Phytomonas sp. EM1]|eukprot:CCW64158.1 unnamed protein product [Phytomonas sp. isolate EM1]